MRTRTFVVRAKDSNATIAVWAEIVDTDKNLTIDELEVVKTRLCDAVMRAIPDLPYVGVPLSKLKVRP